MKSTSEDDDIDMMLSTYIETFSCLKVFRDMKVVECFTVTYLHIQYLYITALLISVACVVSNVSM